MTIDLAEALNLGFTPEEIGHKAYNIAVLASLGLPVPQGLLITYGLVQQALGSQAILEDLAALCLKKLTPPLIIRSSASREDSVLFSFAGQYESVKGITERATFQKAFRIAATSIDSERAITYCEKAGIPRASIKMSLLVQEQIETELTGVICTRHPLRPDEPIMYAEWLVDPDAVASGEGEPHAAIISRSSSEDQCSDLSRHHPFIPDLMKAALTCEIKAGTAAEIEWGFTRGTIYVFQMRPASMSFFSTDTISNGPTFYKQHFKGTPISLGQCIGQGMNLSANQARSANGKIIVSKSGSQQCLYLLPSCAGAVLLSGGLLSHAAHLARELKVPAIISQDLLGAEIQDTAIQLIASTAANSGVYII